MTSNLGVYDENAFKERISINIFERLILNSREAMPNITIGDKNPNFDGDISVCCNENGMYVPKFRIAVQVKTLPSNYVNNRGKNNNNLHKYKYSCDTKSLFSVLGDFTRDLVYLIMVDIKNEFVYALPITKEYCVSLRLSDKQRKKTLYFDDTEKITDVSKWIITVQEYNEKMCNIKHDPENIKILVPYSVEIPNHVTNAVNYLNHIMDNELWFLKSFMFPEIWHFGLSYMPREGHNEETIGIFEIKQNTDEYVRRFDRKSNQNLYEIQSKNVNVIDCLNHVLRNWIEIFSDNMRHMYALMPSIVLVELVYKIIDSQYSKNMHRAKNGEIVTLHCPYNKLNCDKASEIIQYCNNDLIDLLNELNNRGVNNFSRPWKIPYNYRAEKEEHGMKFFSIEDESIINISNNKLFLKHLNDVCKEIVHRFGDKSENIFKKRNYLIFVTNNFSSARCVVTNADEISISFEINNAENFEVKSDEFFLYQSKNIISKHKFLYHPELSWYAFWYRFCIHSFFEFLKSNNTNEKKCDPLIETIIGNLIVH
ncbi:MAG: hypothetical protein J6O04_04905 [Selenomonadaceae bacterium]|nr:hypothetical protein [Selenomonadaceae bacterium]